jgi:hypothetical protein
VTEHIRISLVSVVDKNIFSRKKGGYLNFVQSLKFLLASVFNLGPRLGFRYWKIYRQAIADPSLVIRWERKCRWESARLEEGDPAASKFFEDWADVLSRCPGGSLTVASLGNSVSRPPSWTQ